MPPAFILSQDQTLRYVSTEVEIFNDAVNYKVDCENRFYFCRTVQLSKI